ncbi:hypothetical protein [Novosphingobium sp.]|uniref:hypothetical protein n=1 Tax=Novosphingobium sp. TaxID=1874826 RepID=UPI0035AEAB30
MMSKQLALSIALSVMAMCGYVLLGGDSLSAWGGITAPRPELYAVSGSLPSLSQFLPVLQ